MEIVGRDGGEDFGNGIAGEDLAADVQVSVVTESELPSQTSQNGQEASVQEPTNDQQQVEQLEEPVGQSQQAEEHILASKEAVSSAMANQRSTGRIWRCSMCPETFRARTIMRFHCQRHYGYRKYTCLRCPKQFKNSEACNIHYNGHYVTKHYSCGRCNKEFAKRSNLIKHQRMHAQMQYNLRKKGRWSCEHCSKCFSKKKDLSHHRHGLSCMEGRRVTARLKESCRRLTELVNSLGSSPQYVSDESSSSSHYCNSGDSQMPDSTETPLSFSSDSSSANSDSDGSIEDNNCSGPESEDSECKISSTTKD